MSEKRKIITSEITNKLIEEYLSGIGAEAIAPKYDLHPNSVRRILKKNNIEIRPIKSKMSLEDKEKIGQLYKDGVSSPEIAKMFNVSPPTIRKYLEEQNIETRSAEEAHRIYRIEENFFDVIDTEEKAYFLGFLYADGNVSAENNSIRLELAREDRDILVKCVKLIYLDDPESHIKDYSRIKSLNGNPEKEYFYSYFTIYSKYMVNVLKKLGCPEKKSLIIEWPKWLTNSELQRHFIRGYYDGVGSIYLTDVKTRGANTKIISTLDICQNISEIINANCNTNFTVPNITENKDIYTIEISGNRQIRTMLEWLYKDATIWLDRKYNLYQELLEKIEETDELIAYGTQGYSKRYYKT
jgi:intein-encoded DNA endonuclease-like protein